MRECQELARQWMTELPWPEQGRMFGLLLTQQGQILRAQSGGHWPGPGWVKPIPLPFNEDLRRLAAESEALLAEYSQQMQSLADSRVGWEGQRAKWEQRRQRERQELAQRKLERAQRRCLGEPVDERESQADSRRWREFRKREQQALQAAQAPYQAWLELKRLRRQTSARLQRAMDLAWGQGLLPGLSTSWASLYAGPPPSGAGHCCAPKLLYTAFCEGLTPVGMAEFWWGPDSANGARQSGHFYPACRTRCQPLLEPLWKACLEGLPPLQVHYEDDHLLVVEKPAGVLSVAGRGLWHQDHMATRLARPTWPVHRLDLDTSGLLLFALTPEVQARLQQQFADRQVEKLYQAILEGEPDLPRGRIELPLGKALHAPGQVAVDPSGKWAATEFESLGGRRVQLRPLSGRTHQLRVHCREGLGQPILGDRLYGTVAAQRLHLHACELGFRHPRLDKWITLKSECPF